MLFKLIVAMAMGPLLVSGMDRGELIARMSKLSSPAGPAHGVLGKLFGLTQETDAKIADIELLEEVDEEDYESSKSSSSRIESENSKSSSSRIECENSPKVARLAALELRSRWARDEEMRIDFYKEVMKQQKARARAREVAVRDDPDPEDGSEEKSPEISLSEVVDQKRDDPSEACELQLSDKPLTKEDTRRMLAERENIVALVEESGKCGDCCESPMSEMGQLCADHKWKIMCCIGTTLGVTLCVKVQAIRLIFDCMKPDCGGFDCLGPQVRGCVKDACTDCWNSIGGCCHNTVTPLANTAKWFGNFFKQCWNCLATSTTHISGCEGGCCPDAECVCGCTDPLEYKWCCSCCCKDAAEAVAGAGSEIVPLLSG